MFSKNNEKISGGEEFGDDLKIGLRKIKRIYERFKMQSFLFPREY